MIFSKSIQLACFLLLAGITNLAYACPKTNCVRIGSWNLEWLGSSNRSQPVDKKTIDGIADLIANQLSIDVIALEEINTELNGKIRGEYFSLKPWHDLQQALHRYGYKTQEGESGYAQHVVLAWRTPVTVIQLAKDLPVPEHYDLHEFCRSSKLRKPLAGWFQANQFNFWLVGLHLKANGPDTKCSSAIRIEQTNSLLKALGPLIKKDPDVILVGDFNASSRHHSLQVLSDNDFQTLDDRGKRSPASSAHSYHSENSQKANSGSLLDHIMLRSVSLDQWQPRSTTIYKPLDAQSFSKTYSDHVPLWADFYTITSRPDSLIR